MRYKKIRGHQRRQRAIENWRKDNLSLQLDLLKKKNYQYVKVIIHPWCDLSRTKSAIPQPTGKTKQLILRGIIDTYYSWKKQLENNGEPYYLKIWLLDPHFSKSQVVCALGERIDRYEHMFYKPSNGKQFESDHFGKQGKRLDAMKWVYCWDEDHIESDYVGEPSDYRTYHDFLANERWFKKTMQKPHRTSQLDSSTTYYSFKTGDLWLVDE